jgi:hypothetical protein
MAIPIYTHQKMVNTIFQEESLRNIMTKVGIKFVSDPKNAVFLVAHRKPLIQEMVAAFGSSKKYLLWTHEPNHWNYGKKWTTIFEQKIRTITMRSGEIYRNNYYYSEIRRGDCRPGAIIPPIDIKRTIVCLATYFNRGQLVPSVNDPSLGKLRSEIALAGHRIKKLDIFGTGWPLGFSRGESRQGLWALAKYKILVNYHFNLCFENTVYPYYCSEKIWQAIYCGCLPIYFGQKTIYEDFPQNSFIDYTDYGTPEALFDKVDKMTGDEFIERYNKCFKVFQRALSVGNRSREEAAKYVVEQFYEMVDHKNT